MTDHRDHDARQALDEAAARGGAGEDAEIARRILSVAHHLVGPDPEGSARLRAWLDERGRPTGDGRALVRALGEQAETRSVVRGI
ncbi:MAG TPA: hypothetical protein VJ994_02875 [Paracoccaceae bacterium]|nr:hypothetical protein [Paracoccaceae bacterium]